MPRGDAGSTSFEVGRLRSVEKPRLLLVEGEDERRLFEAILRELGRADVQAESCGGKDAMPRVLENVAKRSGFDRVIAVGVVRDAESDSDAAFRSVRDALERGSLQPPARPGSYGLGRPRVGVLLLPPGKRSGMLEDLCLETIASDSALSCVDGFFRCVEERSGRTPRSLSRSRLHAWLASQEEPYTRVGEAAEKGWFPLASPPFEPVRAFLSEL